MSVRRNLITVIRSATRFEAGYLRWRASCAFYRELVWDGAQGFCHELVSQIDVMATIASIVGYELPADQAEDSHDLQPLITGATKEVRVGSCP